MPPTSVLWSGSWTRSGISAPEPDTDFRDLGLDSLDRLTLAVAVERATGHAVPGPALSDAATPADLARRLPATDRCAPVHPEHRGDHPEPGWSDAAARTGSPGRRAARPAASPVPRGSFPRPGSPGSDRKSRAGRQGAGRAVRRG
ncbi:acyl carrier protein [Streptomyces sp. NPDC098926]